MTFTVCHTVPALRHSWWTARIASYGIIAGSLAACTHAQLARDAGTADGAHRDASNRFDGGTRDAVADGTGQPDDRRQRCVLERSYTVTFGHGVNPRREVMRLQAADAIVFEHYDNYGTKLVDSCTAELPACGDPNLVDGGDLQGDLSADDVQLALAGPKPQGFGRTGTADGDAMTIVRDDGHEVILDLTDGRNCSPASASCNPMPEGMKTLLADLETLSTWLISTCAARNTSVDAGESDGG